MPTVGKLQLNPGTADKPESGYRSRFSHDTEKAEPGYYKVMLDDYKVNAEMTTTTHVGFHQYTFPKTDDAHIILDMPLQKSGLIGPVRILKSGDQ